MENNSETIQQETRSLQQLAAESAKAQASLEQLQRTQKNLTGVISVVTSGLDSFNKNILLHLVNQRMMITATNLWIKGMAGLRIAFNLSKVAAGAFMATATLGISAVVTGLISLVGKFKQKQEEMAEAQRADAERRQQFAQKVSDNVADELVEYKRLQQGWSQLGGVMAKRKFLEENIETFKNLGLQISSVADAENILVRNSGMVISTMMARAKAMAAQSLAVEEYKNALAKQIEAESRKDTLTAEDWQKARKEIEEWKKEKKIEGDMLTNRGQFLYPNENRWNSMTAKEQEAMTNEFAKSIAAADSKRILLQAEAAEKRGDNALKIMYEQERLASGLSEKIQNATVSVEEQAAANGVTVAYQEAYNAKVELAKTSVSNVFDEAAALARIQEIDDELAEIKRKKEELQNMTFAVKLAVDPSAAMESFGFPAQAPVQVPFPLSSDSLSQEDALNAEKEGLQSMINVETPEQKAARKRKAAEEARKAAEARRKAAEEASRLEKEAQQKLQDDELASLREGKEKELKLIELTTKRKLQAIDDEEAALLKKRQDSGAKGLTEDDKNLFNNRRVAVIQAGDNLKEGVKDSYAEQVKDREKEMSDAMRSENERQRQALRDRYNQQVEWARKQAELGNMTPEKEKAYKDSAGVRFNKEMLDLQTKQYVEYAGRRREIEESLKKDIERINAGSGSAEAKAALVEQRKKVADKERDDLNKAYGLKGNIGEEGSAFQSWVDQLTNSSMEQILTMIETVRAELGKVGESDPDKRAELNAQLTMAREQLPQSKTESEKKAEDAESKSARKAANWENSKKALNGVSTALDGIADSFGGMSEALDQSIGVTKTVISATVTSIDAISSLGKGAGSAVEGTSKAAAASMKSLETASVILLVVSAALQAAMAIANLFNKDAKKNKQIEAISGQIKALQRDYDQLERAVDRSFSSTKAKNLQEQQKNLEEQKRMVEEQRRLEMEKKKTDYGAVDEYDSKLAEIDNKIADTKEKMLEAIMGTDVMSAIDQFATAYAEAWSAGDPSFGTAEKVVKNLIKGMLLASLKNKLQKPVEKLVEYLAKKAGRKLTANEEKDVKEMQDAMDRTADSVLKGNEAYFEDSDKERKGVTGELRAEMTEGTASQLVGLWNMTALDTRSVRESASQMRIDIGVILEQNAQIIANTANTAIHTEKAVSSLTEGFGKLDKRLESIESNTRGYTGRG